MDNVRVYVLIAGGGGNNWQQIDLQGGDLITLQKRIGYIETGESAFRQGEYSETFLIPETPTNRKVFASHFRAHVNNVPERYPAYIYVNSYLVSRGVIEVEGVTYGINGKATLKVDFLGEDVNFFLSLQEPLNTLDFTELNNFVTGSLTNIDTLTYQQVPYYDPAVPLDLFNSVKFGFVDYQNSPYYTNTDAPGRDLGRLNSFVGLGPLNGGQHFYWSGSYNFLPGTASAAPTTVQLQNNRASIKTFTLGAPNSQSVDTLYGKGGFYLGHNYNAYFSNGYLIDKIIREQEDGYVWEAKNIFPTDHPVLNSQLIYKDLAKPGTNQYWYKEVNDARMSLATQDFDYSASLGNPTTINNPTVTSTLRLIDEQGTVVASVTPSWSHTVSGVNNVTSSTSGLWRVGLDALPVGNYSIELDYSFTTVVDTSGTAPNNQFTHFQVGTAPIINQLRETNFKKDNQYFFNFLPEEYTTKGTFYYDGQDGVNFELHYNFRRFLEFDRPAILLESSAELFMPDGGTQLRFGVDANELRLNYTSMLPNITRGQFLSEMIRLGNLYFDVDDQARVFRLAPFLEFYRDFSSGAPVPIDITYYVDTITPIEVSKKYPFDQYTIEYNTDSNLPYNILWQLANNDFTSNPSSFTYDITGLQGTDFTVGIGLDHNIAYPYRDILFGDLDSASDPTYAPSNLPALRVTSDYTGVTIGSLFPSRYTHPARTLVDSTTGEATQYTFAPLVDTRNTDFQAPPLFNFLDAGMVLFTSYQSASAYGAIDNKCFKYVYDANVCDWSGAFPTPFLKFATFTTTYDSSERESTNYYTTDTTTQDTYYNTYFYKVRLNQNLAEINPGGLGAVYQGAISYIEQRYDSGSVVWKPTLDIIDTSFGDYLGISLPDDFQKFRRVKVRADIPDQILGRLSLNTLINLTLWDSTVTYYINNIEVNLDNKNTCTLDLLQFNYG